MDDRLASSASEAADRNARPPLLRGAINRLATLATEKDAQWGLVRHPDICVKVAVPRSTQFAGKPPSETFTWKGELYLVTWRQLLVIARRIFKLAHDDGNQPQQTRDEEQFQQAATSRGCIGWAKRSACHAWA
jgi:hypothetical protein